MTLDELIRSARAGKLLPVCVLSGTERVLIERAVDALRSAALADGIPGFNEDVFQGQGLSAQSLLSAARTMPMMAKMRFVLVRNLDAMPAARPMPIPPATSARPVPAPVATRVAAPARIAEQ